MLSSPTVVLYRNRNGTGPKIFVRKSGIFVASSGPALEHSLPSGGMLFETIPSNESTRSVARRKSDELFSLRRCREDTKEVAMVDLKDTSDGDSSVGDEALVHCLTMDVLPTVSSLTVSEFDQPVMRARVLMPLPPPPAPQPPNR